MRKSRRRAQSQGHTRQVRIGGRTVRRSARALLLSAGILTPLLLGVGPVSAITIPSGFFTVLDQNGANDQPGQGDLTQMGRDESDGTLSKFFWSWDDTDFSGQRGDACAQYDTNANGNVDFVVCVEIEG